MGWMAEKILIQWLTKAEDFLISAASRLILEPTQPPIQWILGVLSTK
jgi:hypothetical protein